MPQLTLYPYLLDERCWVFDDEKFGLKEEAFVLGMTEIISKVAPEKSSRQSLRLGPSAFPSFTRSIEFETASTNTWSPIERRATLSPLISGTPAPNSVPSIRAKRAIANCATSGPIIGIRKIIPSIVAGLDLSFLWAIIALQASIILIGEIRL